MALLIAKRASLALLLGGCFGGSVDPTGHPCTTDADCALGDGLVCDQGAGVCVDPSSETGESGDATADGQAATSGMTSTTSMTSTTVSTTQDGSGDSSGSVTAVTASDGSEATGEPGMLALDAIAPNKGRGDIDRDVVVYGAGFDDEVMVWFGDDLAENLSVAPDQIQVRVPANAAVVGPVDVTVERAADMVTISGAYRRVRGYPTFDALDVIEMADEGVAPAAFEMAAGDFVGDDAIDLVMVWENGAGRVMVAEGDGAGGFSIGWEHADPAISVDRGDFNEDGALDFVTTGGPGLRVYENDGVGGFTFSTTPGQIPLARGITTLDVDHVDGPDVVLRGSYSVGIQVWRNDGGGGLIAPVVYSADEITSGDFIARSSTGDVTGDGWDDIVTPVDTAPTPNGFVTHVNDGSGGFLDPVLTELPGIGRSSIVAQLDAGVDDLLDVVALTYNTNAYALTSTGDGSFDVAEISPGLVTVNRVEAADFNCDDDTDLVLIDGGAFTVHRGSPGGSFSQAASEMFSAEGGNRAVAAFDFDGDDLADMLIAHYAANGVLELFTFRNTSAQ